MVAMPRRVALIQHAGYARSALEASIRRALGLIGVDPETTAGARVLLKPNILGAYPPSMGVTTHPVFVAAVGRIFQEAGAQVSVGDSPNGVHGIDLSWEMSGIHRVCREEGFQEVRFEAQGSVARGDFMIARPPLEADLVINLPKFKTHGLTIMTLAAKNLFGCVSGMQKSALHREHPVREDFAKAIVTIAEAVSPALTIVDGITAMEGDGPSAGTLRDLNVIIAGTNIYRVDEACCQLVGLPPSDLDTLAAAQEFGLWDPNAPAELVGDPIQRLRPENFRLPATYTKGMRDWWISRLVTRLIWTGVGARPAIDDRRCKLCGLCVKACPVQAIAERKRGASPHIDLHACIRCFCCNEICPHRAIDLKQSLPVRIWRTLSERRSRSALAKMRRSEEQRR